MPIFIHNKYNPEAQDHVETIATVVNEATYYSAHGRILSN